jgi:hypothetical protein
MNKGGDTLASGGIRAQFPPAGSSVSQKKWDEMWKDYTPTETFEKPKRKKKKN